VTSEKCLGVDDGLITGRLEAFAEFSLSPFTSHLSRFLSASSVSLW
jgi:hypothetical protein